MVSLALIIAAILIGVESFDRIRRPDPLPQPYTLWVLLAVVGIKIVLSWYVSAVGKDLKSSAVQSDAWHHLSDAIISGFASIGIFVAMWIRNPAADDTAALGASRIIIFNACRQLRLPVAELLDANPPPQTERSVRSLASRVTGVVGLDRYQVRKAGFRYYVDPHVVVDGSISVRQGHYIAHRVQDTILRSAPRFA